MITAERFQYGWPYSFPNYGYPLRYGWPWGYGLSFNKWPYRYAWPRAAYPFTVNVRALP